MDTFARSQSTEYFLFLVPTSPRSSLSIPIYPYVRKLCVHVRLFLQIVFAESSKNGRIQDSYLFELVISSYLLSGSGNRLWISPIFGLHFVLVYQKLQIRHFLRELLDFQNFLLLKYLSSHLFASNHTKIRIVSYSAAIARVNVPRVSLRI